MLIKKITQRKFNIYLNKKFNKKYKIIVIKLRNWKKYYFILKGPKQDNIKNIISILKFYSLICEKNRKDKWLIKKNKLIDNWIDKLNTKLSFMLTDLNIKEEEINTLLYALSHNLKTIILSLDNSLSKMSNFKQIDNKFNFYLDKLFENFNELNCIIEDLKLLHRISTIRELPDYIDFSYLIEQIIQIDDINEKIENKWLKINIISKEEFIFGEISRLKLIFYELIKNAISHNASLDKLEINIKVNSSKNFKIIEFWDNGKGVDKKYINNIFSIFYKLSPYKSLNGTGIGLTLVKKIVELHKGEIFVDPEYGNGLKYIIKLPHKIKRYEDYWDKRIKIRGYVSNE